MKEIWKIFLVLSALKDPPKKNPPKILPKISFTCLKSSYIHVIKSSFFQKFHSL